jgi:hypothetical protein
MSRLAPLLALLAGCAGGEDDQCAERWRVWQLDGVATSAEVAGGQLVLSAQTDGTGSALMLGIAGLGGDFTVEVDFVDATLPQFTAYFWAYVRDPVTDELVYASVLSNRDGVATRSVGTGAGSVEFVNLEAGPTALSGQLRLSRQAGAVSLASVDPLDQGAEASALPFAHDPVDLRMAIGSEVVPETTDPVVVHVDAVRITAAAGDLSDEFDVHCLYTPEPL